MQGGIVKLLKHDWALAAALVLSLFSTAVSISAWITAQHETQETLHMQQEINDEQKCLVTKGRFCNE
jgi:hypothetical protein